MPNNPNCPYINSDRPCEECDMYNEDEDVCYQDESPLQEDGFGNCYSDAAPGL